MEISQGKVIIAQPFLNDGLFKRSVILLTEHNENGSMGFIVNRRMIFRLKDVIPNAESINQPLFFGGPLSDDQLFYVHRLGAEVKNSIPIGASGWYWGGDFENIIDLLNSNRADFNDIHFFIGYAGWETGQLEEEFLQKTWIVAEADYSNIFSHKYEEIWGNELKRIGSNYAVLGNFPDEPSLN